MHKLLVLPVALAALCATSIQAQESPAPGALIAQAEPTGAAASTSADKVRPGAPRSLSTAATAAPATTPAPKKRGFFKRVFGGKEGATPAPATPAPSTPRVGRKPPRKAPESEAPAKKEPAASVEKPKSKTAPVEPAKVEKEKQAEPENPAPTETGPETTKSTGPTATPAPGKKGAKPKAGKAASAETATPEPKAQTKEQAALQQAIASGDADAIEKAKYAEAKVRASEDERVRDLKQKADEAPTDEEGRKALRAYNKALFQKMRSLQPDIKERADRMEAAVMKQLDAPGGGE